MHKILITGGSGLLGTRLTELLIKKNFEVRHLGRSNKKRQDGVSTFTWDIPSGKIDVTAFEGVETIVHLAGANVGEKRWNEKRKNEILRSRTDSTRLLFDFLNKGNHTVTTFISASAIGYYGFGDEQTIFREDAPAGTDYLASVVKQWEAEVDRIAALAMRVVKVRVGVVLSGTEGALGEMVTPVRYYVGAPLGSGDQKISWIHIDDVCAVFMKVIEDAQFEGPVNAVAPAPVSNRELTRAIARALRKPLILPPIPSFVLKILFGEMASLVLNGSSVSNEKLARSGFQYKFPDLNAAVDDLLIPRS